MRHAAAGTQAAPSVAEGRESEPATYFRSISAISPGSLATAYQAIRAQEAAISPAIPASEPAILSGLGIPAALSAYGETIETD